jgi:hypothetical protein
MQEMTGLFLPMLGIELSLAHNKESKNDTDTNEKGIIFNFNRI